MRAVVQRGGQQLVSAHSCRASCCLICLDTQEQSGASLATTPLDPIISPAASVSRAASDPARGALCTRIGTGRPMVAVLLATSSAPAKQAGRAVLARSSCPNTCITPAAAAREREVLRRAERAAHLAGAPFYPYTRELGLERAQRNLVDCHSSSSSSSLSTPSSREAAVAFEWSADWLRPLPPAATAEGERKGQCDNATMCLPEACPEKSWRQSVQQRHGETNQLLAPATTPVLSEMRPCWPQATGVVRKGDENIVEEGVPPVSAVLTTAAEWRPRANDAAYTDARGCHQETTEIDATTPGQPGTIPAGL